jgi:hypothetical protein
MTKLSMQQLEKTYVEANEIIKYAHLKGIDSTRYRAVGCIKSGLVLIASDNNKLRATIDSRSLNLSKINNYLIKIKNNSMTMISAAFSIEKEDSYLAEILTSLNMSLFKLAELINSPGNKSRAEIRERWISINETVLTLLSEKEKVDSMFLIEKNQIQAI